MQYYATPTGSEGFSGTGSKEEPTNFGISLAQTFQSQQIRFIEENLGRVIYCILYQVEVEAKVQNNSSLCQEEE